MIALLEASPRLGRMLRGLCRLLGIKLREGVVPPALILPKRSRQKRRPQSKLRGNIRGQADATSNQPASSLLRNSSQPPSREQEFSDASQSADCEIASELLSLHEHILRRAEAYPAIDQAPPDPDPPSFVPTRQRLS